MFFFKDNMYWRQSLKCCRSNADDEVGITRVSSLESFPNCENWNQISWNNDIENAHNAQIASH